MSTHSLTHSIKAYWRRRIINRYPIPIALWQQVIAQLPLLRGLSSAEVNHLRSLSSLFLHYKSIHGVQNFSITEQMRLIVAAQASLLILYLDLDDYRGWHSVLLYPGAFIVERQQSDEIGIVHSVRHSLIGEAWGTGPVILSWEDVARTLAPEEQYDNVIIHEFAHKLDMGNGTANGMPPLHRTMNRRAWTAVFSQAYQHLSQCLAAGESIPLNPYALESPAEFFAVASEAFFVSPQRLRIDLPQVYQQLQFYYRQNPADRYDSPPSAL